MAKDIITLYSWNGSYGKLSCRQQEEEEREREERMESSED